MEKLKSLPKVEEVKGKGLMIGVDIKGDALKVAVECLNKGLLLNTATEHTLRFLPPLTIKEKEVDEAIEILKEVLSKWKR